MSERDDAREILRELLHEALAGTDGNGVTPQVPPPPVAAVHRPSTWKGVRPTQLSQQAGRGLEHVTLADDDDLNRFVHALLTRQDRDAILDGRVRFTLGGPTTSGVIRVERGALTERKVEEAARTGARLVLGPGAVLTPLAREKARAKGIEIERES